LTHSEQWITAVPVLTTKDIIFLTGKEVTRRVEVATAFKAILLFEHSKLDIVDLLEEELMQRKLTSF